MSSKPGRWYLIAVVGLVVLLGGIGALIRPGDSDLSPAEVGTTASKTNPARLAAPESPASKDTELRKLATGIWQDEYQGKRTLTLREDGTGTMVVELSGLKATLVAPRLTFNME